MLRKKIEIRTESYMPLTPGGEEVKLQDLTPEQRNYIGAKIKIRYLNELFRGEAVFSADLPPFEDVFPDVKRAD